MSFDIAQGQSMILKLAVERNFVSKSVLQFQNLFETKIISSKNFFCQSTFGFNALIHYEDPTKK